MQVSSHNGELVTDERNEDSSAGFSSSEASWMELVFELKHALEKWLSFLQLLHFCPRAWHWSRPFGCLFLPHPLHLSERYFLLFNWVARLESLCLLRWYSDLIGLTSERMCCISGLKCSVACAVDSRVSSFSVIFSNEGMVVISPRIFRSMWWVQKSCNYLGHDHIFRICCLTVIVGTITFSYEVAKHCLWLQTGYEPGDRFAISLTHRYTSGWIVFTATDLMWARSVISVELFSASGPTKLKSISLTVESQVDLNSFRISCSSVNLVISLYRVQASVNMIHFLSVQPAVIVGRLGFEQRFWLIGTFGLVEVGRSYDISLVICSCIVICCCCIWRIIDIARL